MNLNLFWMNSNILGRWRSLITLSLTGILWSWGRGPSHCHVTGQNLGIHAWVGTLVHTWAPWVCAKLLLSARLFLILWTVAPQGPLSMGFSRQEYWNVLPFPPSGDALDPGIETVSPMPPALQVGSLSLSQLGSHWVPHTELKLHSIS